MASVGVSKLESKSFALDELVNSVVTGKVRLPGFQRAFRWEASDVARLFDSIYRGFPIGTLLFWERPAPEGTISFGGVSWTAPKYENAYWVIDGQQRLTSLVLAVASQIRTSPVDRRFNIFFDLGSEEFLALAPGRSPSDEQISVETAFDLEAVLEWTRDNALTKEQRERAFALTKRLRDYQVPTYLVASDDEVGVREIFDRMNTFGKAMRRAEVFQALNFALDGQPANNLADLSQTSEQMGFGEIEDNQRLLLVLATRGPDVLREFRNEFDSDDDRAKSFLDAKAALALAISFMQSTAQAPHARLIPYQHLLVALTRLFHFHPSLSTRNMILLRRWYWRASLAGTFLKGGSTGTLRGVVGTVSPDSATKSIARLLAQIESPAPIPELPKVVSIGRADTRIALSAMYSEQPLSIASDGKSDLEVVSPENLFGGTATDLRKLVPNGPAGIENILLLPLNEHPLDQELLIDQFEESSALRESHTVSDQVVSLLRAGKDHEALELRRNDLTLVITRFVQTQAEWDLSDRASISELSNRG